MLSLYIHIPFCAHKCKYCSFFVVPEDGETLKRGNIEEMKEKYLESLIAESKNRRKQLGEQQIRTLYIWWGTPFQLWVDRLFVLIDHMLETRDCEFLEELSIELNPDPFDEVIDFVKQAQKRYKNLYRLRFSFGIQSFDDKILESSRRNYVYNNLINRFRELVSIKASTSCFNLDFIAFGDDQIKEDRLDDWLPRDKIRRDFLLSLLKSQTFDGVSVYTLELFPGAERYYERKVAGDSEAIFSDEPTIWKEFQRLKKAAMDSGYHRYEISNFALRSKRSLHNMVYRSGGDYLGLGINASGMLKDENIKALKRASENKTQAIRYKNTTKRKNYLWGEWLDEEGKIELDSKERKSELAMLGLRTDHGIELERYRDVLVSNVDEVITNLVASKHLVFDEEKWILKLKSKGFDVYNSVLMELLEEI